MQSLLHKAVYCMEMTAIAGKTTEYSERPCFRGDRLSFANVLPTKNRQIQEIANIWLSRTATAQREPPHCQRTIRPKRTTPGFPGFIGHMFLVCAAFFDT